MSATDRPLKNVMVYDESGNPLIITAAGSIGVNIKGSTVAGYSAGSAAFTPPAAPTDMVSIQGSASKTVRVTRLWLSATQTTAGTNTWFIIKRSTADTAGTSTTLTNVPLDSTSAAATAVIKTYTANPTLGSAVGNLQVLKLFTPTTSTSPAVGLYQMDFTLEGQFKGIVLRGTTEMLVLNFGGAALPAGLSVVVSVEWIEE